MHSREQIKKIHLAAHENIQCARVLATYVFRFFSISPRNEGAAYVCAFEHEVETQNQQSDFIHRLRPFF